ncbi:MAG TPA: hypothetical protein VGG71_00815 [Chitinophagaceae bacterium]|jgi:hypothetical protein
MKQLLITFLMVILLSSCLKESIADAMLDSQNRTPGGGSPAVATMTYEVNGSTVTLTVNDPDKQSSTGYQLGCSKTTTGTNSVVYYLDCLNETGEMTYMFPTDSLTVGNYSLSGSYGLFVLGYNGTNAYLQDQSDSMSFNITSYSKGHISGNFSGRLTPAISYSGLNITYGTPGSVLVTKGSFKDVPVFY